MSNKKSRTYPRRVQCGDMAVQIDRMQSSDRGALERFVAELDPRDLLFLPRDITHPKVIDAWMRALDTGNIASLVVRSEDGTMLGCSSIYTDTLSWSRHVGELRVLIGPGARGRGLGRALIQECFVQALELGLKKLVAQMTTDETSAIAVFEDLGFHAEALLRGHVADREDGLHDLVVLSHDVDAVAARHAAYGMDLAVGG